jgi:hypothetical protein
LIRPFLFLFSSLVLDGALWLCPLFFSIAVVAPCFLFFFLNLYAFIILTLLFVFGLLVYYVYVCYLCLLVVLVFVVHNCFGICLIAHGSFFVLQLVLSPKFVVVAAVLCYLLIIVFVRYHCSCSWWLLVLFVQHVGVYHVALFFVVVLFMSSLVLLIELVLFPLFLAVLVDSVFVLCHLFLCSLFPCSLFLVFQHWFCLWCFKLCLHILCVFPYSSS